MDKTKKIIPLILVVVLILLVAIAWRNRRHFLPSALQPTPTSLKTIDSNTVPVPDTTAPLETVVAETLKIPWEIVFLPDQSMLVTQRAGTIEKISPDRKTLTTIEGVAHIGEGGLLGMVLHPDFVKNHQIYLYLTTKAGSGLLNRVEGYTLQNDQLSDKKTIIEGIPGSSNHDGGRLAFGPDGYLYITTGDAENPANAQDKNSLAGKVLRLKDDGSIPSDNPFGNATYSYGHRNPQGLAWDDQGRLWETEHGPSGSQTGYDELNRIEKGKNYGWPAIKGDQTQAGLETPIANSGSKETWAPSGLLYYKGMLLYAGLRGQSLYVAKIKPDGGVNLTSYLRNKYGRLRTVVLGPDGFIYIATNNTDGRGTPKPGDDKIIRLSPALFN
jgi:glucose/arabinose dehydrogenase